MSATLSFAAKPRPDLGTIATAKLRKQGDVPVTVSRPGHSSVHLALDLKSANELAAKVVHLCHVDIEGKAITALRGEVVVDCISDKIQHIDLIQVDEKSEIVVSVAVIPDARNCPGIKAGGIVEQRMRAIKVKCKANAIPDSLTIDLGDVQLTDVVLVGKLVLPAGITLVTPAKNPLLSVVIPRGLKVVEEVKAAGAEGAAPAAGATPAAGAAAAKPGEAAKAGDAKAAAPANKSSRPDCGWFQGHARRLPCVSFVIGTGAGPRCASACPPRLDHSDRAKRRDPRIRPRYRPGGGHRSTAPPGSDDGLRSPRTAAMDTWGAVGR